LTGFFDALLPGSATDRREAAADAANFQAQVAAGGNDARLVAAAG